MRILLSSTTLPLNLVAGRADYDKRKELAQVQYSQSGLFSRISCSFHQEENLPSTARGRSRGYRRGSTFIFRARLKAVFAVCLAVRLLHSLGVQTHCASASSADGIHETSSCRIPVSSTLSENLRGMTGAGATSCTELDTATSATWPFFFFCQFYICFSMHERRIEHFHRNVQVAVARPTAGIKLNFRVETSVRDGTENRERRHVLISGRLSHFRKCLRTRKRD